MKKIDIARALRDENYYLSLSEDDRVNLPIHPSAPLEVSVGDLKKIAGARPTNIDLSCGWTGICTPCPPQQCF